MILIFGQTGQVARELARLQNSLVHISTDLATAISALSGNVERIAINFMKGSDFV